MNRKVREETALNAGEAYKKGRGFYDNKDYKNAINLFTGAIELDPRSVLAYIYRGNSYDYLARRITGEARDEAFENALNDHNMAVGFGPNALAHERRGVHYRLIYKSYKSRAGTGDFDKAINDLNTAISLDPKSASAYYERGEAYFTYAQKADADDDFTPEAEKKCDMAISDYTKSIELNPQNADCYYKRGLCYDDKMQCDMAIADFTKSIELNTENVDCYYKRALLYDEEKQYDKAISDLKKAMELSAAEYYARYH
ncbi:MAG: tetratricopeptide repeat protein [Treponema sp.]|jgi:tetratricopeptide (TPR) repeat protein|nr:tetratricopeptide repeat protein [Treponema sp.]